MILVQPTLRQYAEAAPDREIIPAGALVIDGRVIDCPCVINNSLDDFAAAYPGFIILNMRLLDSVPSAIRAWIIHHEIYHARFGPNEVGADEFAAACGVRDGWLTPMAVDEICNFIAPARGGPLHASGAARGRFLRAVYNRLSTAR